MRDPGCQFPNLPSPEQYEKVEPKICESPTNCGKTFMRPVGSISRICGECRAKAKKIAERMAKEAELVKMLKAKALTEKVQ